MQRSDLFQFRAIDIDEARNRVADRFLLKDDVTAKMDPALISRLAAIIELGIEGVPVPIIARARPLPILKQQITVTDPSWSDFVAAARQASAQTVQQLKTLIPDEKVGQDFFLSSSFAAVVSAKSLDVIGDNDKVEVENIQWNGEVSIELDHARALVGLREGFVFKGQRLDGTGISVAVADGPVKVDHASLIGRAEIAWSEIDEQSFALPITTAHATRVAGIIAGSGLGKKGQTAFIGIAPGCKIKSFAMTPGKDAGNKATAQVSTALAAMDTAVAAGLGIINLSWGIPRTQSSAYPKTDGRSSLSEAIDQAANFGVVTVKSVGNVGAAPPGGPAWTIPADANAAIVVGAVRPDGTGITNESSSGTTEGSRAVPDICAPSPVVAPSTAEEMDFSEDSNGFTSFAAPVVTGIVTLMRQHKPEATPKQIRDALLASARRIVDVDLIKQGAGIVAVEPALEALDTLS